MTPKAPPMPLPAPNVHVLPAGSTLHRNHASHFKSRQFNPCLGGRMRFSPFHDVAGNCVPTLYGATTREAAAHESIFHDIDPAHAYKTVRLDVVTGRSVSVIRARRTITLAALFAPDLQRFGVNRADLIETPKSYYRHTTPWAKAIHQAAPNVDGLIWTSRRCDPAQCVVLFGDRVSVRDFDEIESIDVETDPDILLELRGYGARSGIVIVS